MKDGFDSTENIAKLLIFFNVLVRFITNHSLGRKKESTPISVALTIIQYVYG